MPQTTSSANRLSCGLHLNPMSETLTVSELCSQIEAAIKAGFQEEVWVEGILSNLTRSQNGHVYFELVDSSGQLGTQAKSTISVTLFAKTKSFINKRLKAAGGTRMEDGIKLRIRGEVSYYAAQGRVQLIMSMIDTDYTVGQLAADKERLLKELKNSKLLDANSLVPLAMLPLNVAVITSINSAAYHDFTNELTASPFPFVITPIDCRVQGLEAVPTIVNAIASAQHGGADVAVVIRGGGSKGDLVAFDHRDVAIAIAKSKLPVITGIGHDIDRSVADDVAYLATKTPTAAAGHLISVASKQAELLRSHSANLSRLTSRNLDQARSDLRHLSTGLNREAANFVSSSDAKLKALSERVFSAARHQVVSNRQQLTNSMAALNQRPPALIEQAQLKVDSVSGRLKALDPSVTMKRGWSITRTEEGKLVRDPTEIADGTTIVTTTKGGDLRSVTVNNEEP